MISPISLNPRYLAWRRLSGPDAPAYGYSAFISQMCDAYRRARQMRPDQPIYDHDDFDGFIAREVDRRLDTHAEAAS